ncbi:hypothetical protein F7U66_01585 [Vibrio parahaemolyticus]|nr:hypothetical protein [Vibrio parahaemolyticus]
MTISKSLTSTIKKLTLKTIWTYLVIFSVLFILARSALFITGYGLTKQIEKAYPTYSNLAEMERLKLYSVEDIDMILNNQQQAFLEEMNKLDASPKLMEAALSASQKSNIELKLIINETQAPMSIAYQSSLWLLYTLIVSGTLALTGKVLLKKANGNESKIKTSQKIILLSQKQTLIFLFLLAFWHSAYSLTF